MPKEFNAFNHGKGKVDLQHHVNGIAEMRPIEIHLKENATYDDKPGFTIVMADRYGRVGYGQVSLKMLNEALKDIGYEMKKI